MCRPRRGCLLCFPTLLDLVGYRVIWAGRDADIPLAQPNVDPSSPLLVASSNLKPTRVNLEGLGILDARSLEENEKQPRGHLYSPPTDASRTISNCVLTSAFDNPYTFLPSSSPQAALYFGGISPFKNTYRCNGKWLLWESNGIGEVEEMNRQLQSHGIEPVNNRIHTEDQGRRSIGVRPSEWRWGSKRILRMVGHKGEGSSDALVCSTGSVILSSRIRNKRESVIAFLIRYHSVINSRYAFIGGVADNIEEAHLLCMTKSVGGGGLRLGW
ncbi:hypothetical protein FA13DRAFT_1865018 [Coprinellus micaceus]|uniref:Uncharacterized protein n=1 Tax=Coprinellus micaceus TaxID=71717 RepID=A0A4Y7T4Z9_COPMI|nr:hypothetical protein FA13DRAFT_1865018 [Coprinellus micaceus]